MALKERRRRERMNVLRDILVTLSTLHLLKSRLKTDAPENAKRERRLRYAKWSNFKSKKYKMIAERALRKINIPEKKS